MMMMMMLLLLLLLVLVMVVVVVVVVLVVFVVLVVVVTILGTDLQFEQFLFCRKSETCLPKVHADSSTPGADLLSITLTVDQAISGGVLGTLGTLGVVILIPSPGL